MNKFIIVALIFSLVLVSGCIDTQSQISQKQEVEVQKEVDLELLNINCENTEWEINIPNDYGARCYGEITNHGTRTPRYVKAEIVLRDDSGIIESTNIQVSSRSGEVPPGETRSFDQEFEIKRPFTDYNYEITYPEEFVS